MGHLVPGFYVSAGMIDAHPALKAVSPQAPVTDYFIGDDSFHNGAFMLAANFGFYTNFPVRRAPERPQARPAFDYGTPTATTSTCRWARSTPGPRGSAWPRTRTTGATWTTRRTTTSGRRAPSGGT